MGISHGRAQQASGAPGALRTHRGLFLRYLVVGGLSTLADWAVFFLCAVRLGLHYQAAVAIAMAGATGVHYVLNKRFTFRCRSRRILRQVALHLLVSAVYLLGTMACMYFLVGVARLPLLPSRVVTTGLMTVVSFTLNRVVTFNPDYV